MGHLKLCVVHFANANRAFWLSGTNSLMPKSQNSSYFLKNLFSGREHKCKPDVKGLDVKRLKKPRFVVKNAK
jgi:hypothetical protein